MTEKNLSVKEIIAWEAMNGLIYYKSRYEEISNTDISKMNVCTIQSHEKSMADAISIMNFYYQLLCHPMDSKRCSEMLANDHAGKIRGSITLAYNLDEVAEAVKKKDDRNLIEYYFDCMDKLIDEGNNNVAKLKDICNSVTAYTNNN